MKKLSIVTIVLNHTCGIRRTAKSVQLGRPNWVEWIIIDGKSEDGTLDVLKEFEADINFMISEEDSGISDAFNKGIASARGEAILFLNAGDVLEDGFYKFVQDLYIEPSKPFPPILVGKIRLDSRLIGGPVQFAKQKLRNFLPHQAMIINREVFDVVGSYSHQYRIAMDYEWSLRLKDLWSEIVFFDRVFAVMEPGGLSMSYFWRTYKEYHMARTEHGMPWLSSLTIAIYYTLRGHAAQTIRLAVRWVAH